MTNDDDNKVWLAIIGRSLAFLCLTKADLRDKDLATQGRFLESLGLSRKEAAALLGTSYASLAELLRPGRKKRSKRGRAKQK